MEAATFQICVPMHFCCRIEICANNMLLSEEMDHKGQILCFFMDWEGVQMDILF